VQLIGSFSSPFVRRVAVTMKLYGLPFEHYPYATDRNAADIGRFNPLGRVPANHVWKPWLDHLEDQVRRGLQALDSMVQWPWFIGTGLSQADVSTIVAVQAMRHDMPHLAPQGQFRALDGLVRAAASIDAFASTLPGQ